MEASGLDIGDLLCNWKLIVAAEHPNCNKKIKKFTVLHSTNYEVLLFVIQSKTNLCCLQDLTERNLNKFSDSFVTFHDFGNYNNFINGFEISFAIDVTSPF